MINHKFYLKTAFQEILYMTDNWINEGSGWIVELIESQYINISTYRPLSGSSYVKLPAELRSSKKGLINIKNNDQKCFRLCHIRHINPVKIHSRKELHRMTKSLLMILIMIELVFLCEKKIFINVFCYENKLVFSIYISSQKFENSMDLLFLTDGDISHYAYIKDFDRFMFPKTKNKSRK